MKLVSLCGLSVYFKLHNETENIIFRLWFSKCYVEEHFSHIQIINILCYINVLPTKHGSQEN